MDVNVNDKNDKNVKNTEDKSKENVKNDKTTYSKTYVESIIRDRDKAKEKMKSLEEQLSELNKKISSVPPEDELAKMKEDLEALRTYREEMEKKKQEAELKDKSESERLKIQLDSIQNEYQTKLKDLEGKLQNTQATYEEKLQKREEKLNKLSIKVLEGRIMKVAIEEKAYSPEQIVLMTKHLFRKNDEGEFYALNNKGKEVTVEEFIAEFLNDEKNSNLVAVEMPASGGGGFGGTRKKKKKSDKSEIDVSKATPTDIAQARIAGFPLEQWLEIQQIKKEIKEAREQSGG